MVSTPFSTLTSRSLACRPGRSATSSIASGVSTMSTAGAQFLVVVVVVRAAAAGAKRFCDTRFISFSIVRNPLDRISNLLVPAHIDSHASERSQDLDERRKSGYGGSVAVRLKRPN